MAGGRSASVRVITIRWDADHSHSESHVAILKRMKHEDKNPTISILHEQALGIINVCKTPHQHCVDTRTIAIAQAIVAEARTALPHDKVLAAAVLEDPVTMWSSVQSAMEVVAGSLLPT